MNRTSLLLGLGLLAIVVIAPFAFAKSDNNPFEALYDALAAISAKLDAFIASTAAEQAAQDARLTALEAAVPPAYEGDPGDATETPMPDPEPPTTPPDAPAGPPSPI